MALLGTENSIRCPKCGGIHFEEKTIVVFHEGMNMKKLQENIELGARAAIKKVSYSYTCISCNHKLI